MFEKRELKKSFDSIGTFRKNYYFCRMRKTLKYCPDICKYLVDISKVVLGSVVISPVIKSDFSFDTDSNMIIAGIITSLFTVVSGIFLINISK